MTHSIFEISIPIYLFILALTLDEYICDNYRIERPFPYHKLFDQNWSTFPSRPRPNKAAALAEYTPRPFPAVILEAVGMAYVYTIFLLALYALLTSPFFYVNLTLLFLLLEMFR